MAFAIGTQLREDYHFLSTWVESIWVKESRQTTAQAFLSGSVQCWSAYQMAASLNTRSSVNLSDKEGTQLG